jgi:hypothetical protein
METGLRVLKGQIQRAIMQKLGRNNRDVRKYT